MEANSQQEQCTGSASCSCGAKPQLMFACSGGSDVGHLSDELARELTRRGTGKMYCLAGIGGNISGIMATTDSAEWILAIDGCHLGCGAATLRRAGFDRFVHLSLDQLGIQKGRATVTPDAVSALADTVQQRLAEGVLR